MRKNGLARTGNGNEAVEMEKIVLKAPENSINANAGMPGPGSRSGWVGEQGRGRV